MAKKTWVEKLHDSKDLPKVVELAPNAAEHWGGHTMTVPAPLEVDTIMREVPEGKLITIAEIRQKIAKKHGSDIGCPLTCGIFSWISANAAEEEREILESQGKDGSEGITPWWRTLKTGGFLSEKFPGYPDFQRKLLESEGHKIVRKGKKYLAQDYGQRLVKV